MLLSVIVQDVESTIHDVEIKAIPVNLTIFSTCRFLKKDSFEVTYILISVTISFSMCRQFMDVKFDY